MQWSSVYQERSKGGNKREEIEKTGRTPDTYLSTRRRRRRLSFSTKPPAALARSQAPIVYHTRVQIWRRLDSHNTCHGPWLTNPTSTMFSTPPGLCSEHTHEDDGDLSAHPHVPADGARHIAREFLALAPARRCRFSLTPVVRALPSFALEAIPGFCAGATDGLIVGEGETIYA
jgi:hypothetical protein